MICVSWIIILAARWFTDFTYNTLQQLQEAVHVSEKFRHDVEQCNIKLAVVRHATSSLLSAMCDVVCWITEDYRFHDPSQKAFDLFRPSGASSVTDFDGANFLSFVPDLTERERFQRLLAERQAADATDAAAPCINLQAVDGQGRSLSLAIFHARIEPSIYEAPHVLGIRILSVEEHEGDATDAVECIDLPLGREASTPWPAEETSIPEGACHTSDNLMSIVFDAGTLTFELLCLHPFVRSRSSLKHGDLKSLFSLSSWYLLEPWVTENVKYAPWERTITSKRFPGGPLVMSLVRRRSRCYHLMVHEAWLEIHPPEDGILPTMIWLRGFSPANFTLEPMRESDEDSIVDSMHSLGPDDSASCPTASDDWSSRAHAWVEGGRSDVNMESRSEP